MEVLWIVNILFPEALEQLTGKGALKASGGWIVSAAEELAKKTEVNLTVISVSALVKEMEYIKGEIINYFIVPFCHNPQKYTKYFKKVNEERRPDVVHIHGTEFPYGWAWLNGMPTNNVVVSIQGLVGVIAMYYRAGLTLKEIVCNLTLHDLLRHSIIGEQRDFYKRGKIENQVLKKVSHVIGRTSFDKSHCMAINPNICYHFCNETLRPEFYSGSWNYDNCVPHSIFLSQASYPIKGLHMIIKAMPFILRKYPDTILRIAGKDITCRTDIKTKIRRYTGYGKIINSLIHEYGLENKVVFVGQLDSQEMKKEYLDANVFVSPSAIENSPNSIGEAQLLGVPVVASYVGGVMDLMQGDANNMYRYEEIEMLADKICNIFEKKEVARLSESIRHQAKERHSLTNNVETTMQIYKNIIMCSNNKQYK